MSSLTATETFKQGLRLFIVFLMLRGSSAHSIIDRPSLSLERFDVEKRIRIEKWVTFFLDIYINLTKILFAIDV